MISATRKYKSFASCSKSKKFKNKGLNLIGRINSNTLYLEAIPNLSLSNKCYSIRLSVNWTSADIYNFRDIICLDNLSKFDNFDYMI